MRMNKHMVHLLPIYKCIHVFLSFCFFMCEIYLPIAYTRDAGDAAQAVSIYLFNIEFCKCNRPLVLCIHFIIDIDIVHNQ